MPKYQAGQAAAASAIMIHFFMTFASPINNKPRIIRAKQMNEIRVFPVNLKIE
jgi:hypothetical protein